MRSNMGVRGVMFAVWGVLALLVLLSGCGRDAVYVGGIGDVCLSDEDCSPGLDCQRGVCIPGDGDDDPDDDPDAGEPDVDEPDTGPEPICRRGQTVCLDESTVGFCIDGFEIEPFEFCGDSVCVDGLCRDDVVCRDGARRCAGPERVQQCRDGRWVDIDRCDAGVCQDGGCVDLPDELPDLLIEGVGFSNDVVDVGGSFSVEFGVANVGRADAGRFQCSVNITQRQPNPNRDQRLAQVTFGGLGAREGEGAGLRVPVPPNIQPGPYRVYVACDVNNQVPESNESNNTSETFSILVNDGPAGQPDLFFEGPFFLFNDVFVQGEPIFGAGVVCNGGRGSADFIQIRATAHALNDPDVILAELGFFEIPGMGPGECFDFEMPLGEALCLDNNEPYMIELQLDPRNRIQELDERNNTTFVEPPIFVEGCDDPNQCFGDPFDPEDSDNPPVLDVGGMELVLCPDDRDIFALPAGPGVGVRLFIETDPGNVIIMSVFSDINGMRSRLAVVQTEGGFLEFGGEVPPDAERLIISLEPRFINNPRYFINVDVENVMFNRDLAVRGVEAQPSRPRVGERFVVSFQEANVGQNAIPVHDVTITLASTQDPNGTFQLATVRSQPELRRGEVRAFNQPVVIPDNLAPGTYQVRVVGDPRNSIGDSNLRNNTGITQILVMGPAQMCVPDRFDPNDSFEQARDLQPGTYDDLSVCSGNDGRDFFRVCPPEGSNVAFNLEFDHGQGDIDIRLLNESQRVIDNSNGVQNTERVEVGDTAEGACFVLEVFLFGNLPDQVNAYSLTLEVDSPPPVNACTEAFEPNNSFDQARPLLEAANARVLDFCPRGDADFYSVVLPAGRTAVFTVTPLGEQPPGDIVLALHDEDLNFITQRFERAPELTFDVETSGTYFLRLVTSAGADLFQYDIDFRVE